MDFRGFARKELQALCKRNKIAANMTNLAMADALSSLDHVEGLEEIIQQRGQESAGVGRTATRARKPAVNVLESGGVGVVSSGSRVRASRKLESDDMTDGEMKEVANTPVVASRKRAPAGASSRRKAEVPSVQRVYSTRRSVSLVEKHLSELCLEGSVRRARPIKIDDELSGESTSGDAKGDAVKIDVPEECTEKILVKDEVHPFQVSTQTADDVNIAVQGNEVWDNGLADLKEVNNSVSLDRSTVIVSVMDNAAMDIVVEIGGTPDNEVLNIDEAEVAATEEEEKGISEDFVNVADGANDSKAEKISCVTNVAVMEEVKKAIPELCATDIVVETGGALDNKVLNTDEADVGGIEEVERATSEDYTKAVVDAVNNRAVKDVTFVEEVENVVGAKDNVDDAEKGVAAIEGVEEAAIFNDCVEVIDTVITRMGMADAAAKEVEKVVTALSATKAAKAESVKFAEQELMHLEVVLSNTDNDHVVPSLLDKKDGEFELTAEHGNGCGSHSEDALVAKLEASIETSADSVQTDSEVKESEAVYDLLGKLEEASIEILADNVQADNEVKEPEAEYDIMAKLEACIEISAENVQADNELTETEADKHDAELTFLADWDSEETRSKKNVMTGEKESQTPLATKGSLSVKATTPVPGVSPHLVAQLSTSRSVVKELPVTDDVNKENIAGILKTEESCKRPMTPYQNYSYRKLVKKFKELTVSDEEMCACADADMHTAKQQHRATPRKALKTIPDNTQKQ